MVKDKFIPFDVGFSFKIKLPKMLFSSYNNPIPNGYAIFHCDNCEKEIFKMNTLGLSICLDNENPEYNFDFTMDIVCDCGHKNHIDCKRYLDLLNKCEEENTKLLIQLTREFIDSKIKNLPKRNNIIQLLHNEYIENPDGLLDKLIKCKELNDLLYLDYHSN